MSLFYQNVKKLNVMNQEKGGKMDKYAEVVQIKPNVVNVNQLLQTVLIV